MSSDITFFTNENDQTLAQRFRDILSDPRIELFDVLVGYFRVSGIHEIYETLDNIEKIRILVGLNVDNETLHILNAVKDEKIYLTNSEISTKFSENIKREMDFSEDKHVIETGIRKFMDYLENGKIEMRVYPHTSIHAKVYIMKYKEGSVDNGRVVTGSSNFSYSGLSGNLEFNVELKENGDFKFASQKFNELWEQGIPIEQEFIETTKKKTWLREDITPYELYLKFLLEYFSENLNDDKIDIKGEYLPADFKKYDYQLDAVKQAKKILFKYNGVFLADVVGLGKTYITALLAKELHVGHKLVICPPVLVDYWKKVLQDFRVDNFEVYSLGKLDSIKENFDDDYFKYIFIDEAHRFRSDKTEGFALLHEICLNKKVVLISATPQNNRSTDIMNLISLFQQKNNSNIIDGNRNIEAFFKALSKEEEKIAKELKKSPPSQKDALHKKQDDIIKKNSQKIRDNVLRKVMVRRVRSEIMKYYRNDITEQGLSFPKLGTPKEIVYKFDDNIDKIFDELIDSIDILTYARYKALTYLINPSSELKSQLVGQLNMRGFMKGLLIKRLESSFFAFSETLRRFKESYEKFIDMYNMDNVYIAKKYNVYDLMSDDVERLMNLVEEGEIDHFPSAEFNGDLIDDLKKDLTLLTKMYNQVAKINTDPKLEYFINELKTRPLFSKENGKIIIFSESTDTVKYLEEKLINSGIDGVISFSGSTEGYETKKEKIKANFDPNYKIEKQQNKYRILITTDILAEGINLHRANILFNYDLPWNPTRIMQRVGRINRIGTKFDEIHVFNFFPTSKSNEHLSLRDNIIAKIQSFHNTLGEDSKFLTESEDVDAYGFYESLQKSLDLEEDDVESELEYLQEIRNIRDNNLELFKKIKSLPKKSRSGKKHSGNTSTISFIKDGELKILYLTDRHSTEELTFFEGLKILKCYENEERIAIENDYYDMLESNKKYFKQSSENINEEPLTKNQGDVRKLKQFIELLEDYDKFTTDEENKIKQLSFLINHGVLVSKTIKNIKKAIEKVSKEDNLHKILEVMWECIPDSMKNMSQTKVKDTKGIIEVILSEYLKEE